MLMCVCVCVCVCVCMCAFCRGTFYLGFVVYKQVPSDDGLVLGDDDPTYPVSPHVFRHPLQLEHNGTSAFSACRIVTAPSNQNLVFSSARTFLSVSREHTGSFLRLPLNLPRRKTGTPPPNFHIPFLSFPCTSLHM